MPPCRSIELFSKSTRGIDPGRWCPVNNPYLDLSFTMDEEMYKEITIVPAYNFQSLVGNAGSSKMFYLLYTSISTISLAKKSFYMIGGYIGLFIGFSIAQVPDVVTHLVKMIKTFMNFRLK